MPDLPGRDLWLPPTRVQLLAGVHLRPIRGADVDIDYPAVMGSRERLWAKYGEAWGWPPPTMTQQQDRVDLEHHEREILAHESFNYAVLNDEESRLLGCVYLDPPGPGDDGDVRASWWVIDELTDGPIERALDAFVPNWVIDAWPFQRPVFAP
jgi:hypothetical protein